MPYIKPVLKQGLKQEIEALSDKIVRICEATVDFKRNERNTKR